MGKHIIHGPQKKASSPIRPAGGSRKGAPWEPSAEQLQVYAEVVKGQHPKIVAAMFAISTRSVMRYCEQINDWLVPQYMDKIKAMKADHAEKLMHVYLENMAAWERSKEDAEETTETEGTTANGMVSTSQTKRKGQVGNPSYLESAKDALKQIREIWGANAPLKIEHSGELRVAGMSVDEANRQLADRLAQARENLMAPAEN